MKCTNKEQETCNVEKLGCKGCYYSREISIKALEKEIADKLDNEQWKNWQEVLKYIKELQENQCNHNISNESISKQIVKYKILIPMQEEYDKAIERFFKEDIYHVRANGDVAQELGYFIGKIEKLLEN